MGKTRDQEMPGYMGSSHSTSTTLLQMKQLYGLFDSHKIFLKSSQKEMVVWKWTEHSLTGKVYDSNFLFICDVVNPFINLSLIFVL